MDDLLDPTVLSGLLARSALKDQQAFAELYRRTSSKLLGVALRILRRQDWAEDVLQESFVNIWHHAQDYTQARSAPMTWMTSIVRNRSLDWLRRPREETPDDFELMLDYTSDDRPGPLERLTDSADAKRVARCLEQLEASQRQTIALAFYHGLTHSELAEHLKAPLGTVKTWVRRGLEQLKSCLGTIEPGRR
ncbi:MAG: sigma-70 family RNA polymerase sigma factor [Burkholderiales bacterium]